MLPASRARCGSCEHEVAAALAERAAARSSASRLSRTTGIPESTWPSVWVTSSARSRRSRSPISPARCVDLRLSAWQLRPEEADRRLTAAAAPARRAGERFYGEGEADLAALVLDAARGPRCEPATAGRAPAASSVPRLTEIPGSSDVLWAEVVCYRTSSRRRCSASTLAHPGARRRE